jgi:hypothetical protein
MSISSLSPIILRQDAYAALVEALAEGARETVGDSNDNGNGEQAPTAGGGSHVSRMASRSRRHPRLADMLGDSVAVLGHFARAFGQETSKTVLADVARVACEAIPSSSPTFSRCADWRAIPRTGS